MADRRSCSRCTSSPLPCLYDHDCFRDSGQHFVAAKEIGLPCIASLMRIEAERNLAHEKPLVGDLSEEMGILLWIGDIYRRSDGTDHPAPCVYGSDGRGGIDADSKSGCYRESMGCESMSYAPGSRDGEKPWLPCASHAYASTRKKGKAPFVIDDRKRILLLHEAIWKARHAQGAE